MKISPPIRNRTGQRAISASSTPNAARAARHIGPTDADVDAMLSLAERWTHEGRLEDARTAARHLRAVAKKHTLTITDIKQRLCAECDALLVPGKTCTVRVKGDRRVITCSNCGCVKRLGLT